MKKIDFLNRFMEKFEAWNKTFKLWTQNETYLEILQSRLRRKNASTNILNEANKDISKNSWFYRQKNSLTMSVFLRNVHYYFI